MIIIRSILFDITFYVFTVFYLILSLPFFIMSKTPHLYQQRWAQFILFSLKKIVGLTYEVRGENNIPKHGPYIIASKHQSVFETLALPIFIPKGVYILKKELTQIPIFGIYLKKLKSIPVDRANGKKALVSMVKHAKETVIIDQKPLIIFPEGSRAKPGLKGNYKNGIAILYDELQVQVIPVAINSGYFWKRKGFIKKPGHIIIEFLPGIKPGLSRDDFMARLATKIDDACDALPTQ
jgi:1-acyl-sn-glycerol-3-phosphate acyltransferase